MPSPANPTSSPPSESVSNGDHDPHVQLPTDDPLPEEAKVKLHDAPASPAAHPAKKKSVAKRKKPLAKGKHKPVLDVNALATDSAGQEAAPGSSSDQQLSSPPLSPSHSPDTLLMPLETLPDAVSENPLHRLYNAPWVDDGTSKEMAVQNKLTAICEVGRF